jgi:hypothetical protein
MTMGWATLRDQHQWHPRLHTGYYHYATADTARHLQVIADGNVIQPLPPHAALDLLEAVDWEGIHKLLTNGKHGYGHAGDGVVGGKGQEHNVP